MNCTKREVEILFNKYDKEKAKTGNRLSINDIGNKGNVGRKGGKLHNKMKHGRPKYETRYNFRTHLRIIMLHLNR